MKKEKAFTLLEMVLVIIISGSIFTIIFAILTTMPRIKTLDDARQTLIQQTSDIMNRFAILFQDYTVDYEEYYARKLMGCSGNANRGNSFQRNVNASGYCDNFTNYGNGGQEAGVHRLSYAGESSLNGWNQIPFGQYKHLFRDYGSDTDGVGIGDRDGRYGDADDRDSGDGPDGILDNQNIQELYLISHDGTKRLFLRRIKKGEGDEAYNTIQILRLKGFDAGHNHNFSVSDSTIYDGEIDTWACDRSQYFQCNGTEVPIYEYKMPQDINDGWVDLFDEALDIERWNIQIFPVKNPEYAWQNDDQQINPYIRISLTAGLNKNLYLRKLGWGGLEDIRYSLENLYNTRGFYIQ